MRSFENLEATLANQPLRLGPKLSRIDVGRGREQLYAEQMPQVLKGLAEATKVASIQASTAIEGYDVPTPRAEAIVRRSDATFRNRNEQEFAGYRDAADEVVRDTDREPITPALPLYLATRLNRHTTGKPGRLKTEQNYIATLEGGHKHIIFTPVGPRETESALRNLIGGYNGALEGEAAHPVLVHGLFVLDFLAIHPVDDGNGRISRLLTVYEMLRLGYGVSRYVSTEQLIFDNKNGYYDALEASQRQWHDAKHDPWPWLTYFVSILAEAYDQFEAKLDGARKATGSLKDQARHYALHEAPREFRFAEASAALPGIGDATLRLALNELSKEGKFEAGRGAKAKWKRLTDD